MNPLISVIVPVYNTSQYLDRCIRSISSSIYDNLEIILIDDGSTDSSPKICDKYAAIDKRINVYHNANHGVAYARNYGIRKAKGVYITFIDSDDWVENDYLYNLYLNSQSGTMDIVIGAYCSDYENNNHEINACAILLNKTLALDIKNIYHLIATSWGKLYKLNIIKENNVSFPLEKQYAEDRVFNCYYIRHVRTYTYTNKAIYHYCHDNGNSLTATRTEKKYEDAIYGLKAEKDLLDFLEADEKNRLLFYSAITNICLYFNTYEKKDNLLAFCNRFKMAKEVVPYVYDFSSIKNVVKSIFYLLNLPLALYIILKIKAHLNRKSIKTYKL